ncbi:hypothetical protein FJNA_16090 [Thermus sp. FJN-A]
MSRTRLSSKGQVVLPKAVREALGLKPGDELWVEVEGDSLRLRPLRGRPSLAEVLDRLSGHPPQITFGNAQALLKAEEEEARAAWRR